ncbi:MAG: indole-3-glycerol-phosphate synthase TrpC, partial [Thermoanaerobaculia bacterium]
LASVVEAHDAAEITGAAGVAPDVLGVNARNLSTFETDFAVLETLAKAIPEGPVRLAESGIRTRQDVERLARAGFQAFLVGETLLKSEDPEDALRSLRG